MDTTMKINVIDKTQDIARIAEDWVRLCKQQKNDDFYTTSSWFTALLEITQTNNEIFILTLSKDEELIAILPLKKSRKTIRHIKLNTIEIIGNIYTPYRSATVKEGLEEDAAHEFASYLLKDKSAWDSIIFDDISENDEFTNQFKAHMAAKGARIETKTTEANIRINLATYPSADAYFSSLSKGFRQNIRTSINRTNREYAFKALLLASHLDAIDWFMDDYYEIYASSWKRTEALPHFHRDLARRMIPEGRLRLYQLYFKPSQDGNAPTKDSHPYVIDINKCELTRPEGYSAVASAYFIVHNTIAYCLKMSYNAAYGKFGTGNILLWAAIRDLLEQDGIKVIDFQKGNDEYKTKWGQHHENRQRVFIPNPKSINGRLAYFIEKKIAPRIASLKDTARKIRRF